MKRRPMSRAAEQDMVATPGAAAAAAYRLPGWRLLLVLVAAAGLALGLGALAIHQSTIATWIWGAAILPVLAALVVEIVTSIRRGSIGLDLIAALAVTGALALGETLAGLVVARMYSGGQFLENFAQRRARREMTALLNRISNVALRHSRGSLEEIPSTASWPAI